MPLHNALDKSEKKSFDEMFDIPKLYISSCSNSVQLVQLHPIIISILFHHYKELLECIEELKEIEAKVNAKENKYWMTKEEEESKRMEEIPTILDDGFFMETVEP
jgi:hypothetical protein